MVKSAVIVLACTPWLAWTPACSDDAPAGVGSDATVGDAAVPSDTGAADTLIGDTTPTVDTFLTDTSPPRDTSAWLDTSSPRDTGPTIPEPDITVDPSHCSAPGGGVNIYDLQDPECPDHPSPEPTGADGIDVELDGVIVTGTFGDTMFVQEPAGGPYSGITVFNHEIPVADLEPGDRVDLVGSYSEFFENTQLYLDSFTRVGGGDPPAPFVPDYPSYIATNGPIAELFEGVLVRVEDVTITNTRPDCPKEFGEFEVANALRIDDMGIHWDARLGDQFSSITGPLTYTFGNFKVEPRDEADLVSTIRGVEGAISKCIASECQAPDGALGTQQVVVTELMPDPFGSDLNHEWFELYNPTAEAVDVNGFEIRDCGDQRLALSGPNLVIAPGDYLVLGMSSNYMDNGGVPVDQAYGLDFYLPNTVGSLLIYDGPPPLAALVDQVRYSRFEPWSVFFAGRSLERINPTGDGTDPDNWAAGVSDFGDNSAGTPGRKNDATP